MPLALRFISISGPIYPDHGIYTREPCQTLAGTPIMKTHFVRKKVPSMRKTKVCVRVLAMVRQSQPEEMQSAVNERLQTLGRMVVQKHLETFKQLADK